MGDVTPDFHGSGGSNCTRCEFIMWEATREKSFLLGENQSVYPNRVFNLTFMRDLPLESFGTLEFLIGGYLRDKEYVGPYATEIAYKDCSTCSYKCHHTSGDVDTYRRMSQADYSMQYASMQTGTSKFLKIGGDDTFQLDFFEGDNNSSHVQFFFKIKVTRKT